MKRRCAVFAMALVLLLLPSPGFAAGAEIVSEEQLLAALEEGQTSIRLAANLETVQSIDIPAGTVIDLDAYAWTVVKGTVAIPSEEALIGTGAFTASKNGTIRVLRTVALENAVAGDAVKGVSYTDGETDDAVFYIADGRIGENGTVSLYLKRGKAVSRVTTAQAVYRLGTANAERLSLVYPIAYNLDGGRIEQGANPTEYTAADAPITLLNPVRDGCTFLGWTGSGLTEPTDRVTIPMQSTGSRSYTALWEAAEEEADREQSGTGSRTAGGGTGGGSSLNTGSTSGTETADASEQKAEEAVGSETRSAAEAQQSSRRIAAASSSVETTFHGARPVLETAAAAEEPAVDRTKLCIGMGMLLLAAAGAILLRKRRED